MTFVEVHVNEDRAALEELLREAYSSMFQEEFPGMKFGRVVVWQGRMFQQLETSLEFEHRFFSLWTLPKARIQIGSIRGEVFTTPPEVEGEPAARVKEGGRCGREYMVRPFYCSDYAPDG